MELLTPDLEFDRIEDITFELLESRGITALLIDIDNTLVSRATSRIDDSVFEWVRGMKQAGVSCCLLSNNWHKVIHDYADELGVPVVGKAMKPLPVAYVKALSTIGAHRASTAVVGDQLLTDILGARLCVMPCFLIKPLSTTDLWYTRIFRKIEQRITR